MEIEITKGKGVGSLEPAFLKELARQGLEMEGSKTGELSIALVTRDEMRELNQRYRAQDHPADVLAFDLLETTDATPKLEGEEMEPSVLGEIIICPDVAREQAEQEGHSFREELSFLLIHGLLHLVGYDHETDSDAERMDRRVRQILSSFDG